MFESRLLKLYSTVDHADSVSNYGPSSSHCLSLPQDSILLQEHRHQKQKGKNQRTITNNRLLYFRLIKILGFEVEQKRGILIWGVIHFNCLCLDFACLKYDAVSPFQEASIGF